jgi:hypothetical protein
LTDKGSILARPPPAFQAGREARIESQDETKSPPSEFRTPQGDAPTQPAFNRTDRSDPTDPSDFPDGLDGSLALSRAVHWIGREKRKPSQAEVQEGQ